MLSEAKSRLGAIRETVLREFYGWWMSRTDARVTYHGIELDLSDEQISNAIRGAVARNHYEIGELRLIDEFLPSNANLIELGGGIGFIAAYTHRRLEDDTTHIVVEANDHLIPLLEATRRLNDTGYIIEHAAYAPNKDSTVFYRHRHFWSGSTASRSSNRTQVPATDLARLRAGYNLEEFALIVDIEGGEVELLSELPLLERACSHLIIEFHDTKSEHQAIAEEVARARDELMASSLRMVWSDRSKQVYVNPSIVKQ